jgi:chromosome segregation ATPase
MEPSEITIRVLQEIRDELRSSRAETKEELRAVREESREEFRTVREEFRTVNARFEVIETSLRDVAQQLVMLARGIKTALDARAEVELRFADVERRLEALEKPSH